MSDVSALVLSLGEDYTERALASVRDQTRPVAETVVVRGVSPFHRAFNSGLARVRTAFFVQVDADMILDATCVADLRLCVADHVGIVVGHLRDPLLGRLVGIKLFRTQCFERLQFRDTISFDTDFVGDMERQGWTTVYALKYAGESPAGLHVFGDHRPDYTPHYTFCKYVIEGARYRYRKAGGGIRHLFWLLQSSRHPLATTATVAAAHGIFLKDERDLLQPYPRDGEAEFLQEFLAGSGMASGADAHPEDLAQGDVRTGFKRAYALGTRLRQAHAGAAFQAWLDRLRSQHGVAPWVASVGLCHGLFTEQYTDAAADEDFATLVALLPPRSLAMGRP